MKIKTKFNVGDVVQWKSKWTPEGVINAKEADIIQTGEIVCIDILFQKRAHIGYSIFDGSGNFLENVMEEDLCPKGQEALNEN